MWEFLFEGCEWVGGGGFIFPFEKVFKKAPHINIVTFKSLRWLTIKIFRRPNLR